MFKIGRKRSAGAPLDDVVRRMRPLPYDSMTRWRITQEVSGRPVRDVLPAVRQLLESGRPDDQLAGVQLLDTYFADLDEPLPDECRALEPVLRALCDPQQPPELIAAAIGPWGSVAPDERVVLRTLIAHADGQVRARAVALLPDCKDGGPEDVDLVLDVLRSDPDPRVRCSAAEAVVSARLFADPQDEDPMRADEQWAEQVREQTARLWPVMRPFLRDREAQVRAAALTIALDPWAANDADRARAEQQLLSELVDPDVDPAFVRLAGDVELRKSDLLERLTALQQGDWAARGAVPDRYPEEADRRAMLAEGISHAKGRPPRRRLGSR